MHLTSLYAKDLGVKAGFPIIQDHYIPIPYENYITFHNSDKVSSKCYSYFEDFIKIVKPELEKRDIKIVQVGTEDDARMEGVDHFYNDTTFKQSFHIIKNAKLHVGIDSAPSHVASSYNIPTVTLFSHTYASTCEPLWNKGKAIILESHRDGKKPSFSAHEDPKTVDLIQPEEIANAVFKGLEFKEATTQKTIWVGKKYKSKTIDLLPSALPTSIANVKDADFRIRMDLGYNEQGLVDLLSKNEAEHEIILNKPIKNTQIIQVFAHRISKIIYSADKLDADFLQFLKHSGLEFELNCTKKKNLSEERNKFFNFDIVYQNLEEEAKKLKKEVKKKVKGQFQMYSGKFYLVGDQQVMTLGKDMDDMNFWLDVPYFRLYSEESWKPNFK